MATVKNLYGPNNQSIPCTITSLANGTGSYGAGQASTAVDNTSNLFTDVLIGARVKTSGSALGTNPAVYFYAFGSANGGASYTDGITGTNAPFAGTNPPNCRLLGIINTPASSTQYEGGPWSLLQVFGTIPDHWGIYVVNFTGQTLDASVGSAWYQGVQEAIA